MIVCLVLELEECDQSELGDVSQYVMQDDEVDEELFVLLLVDMVNDILEVEIDDFVLLEVATDAVLPLVEVDEVEEVYHLLLISELDELELDDC